MAETEIHTSGWFLRMSAATVPLPTAVGPASTVSRARCAGVAGTAGVAGSVTRAELALEAAIWLAPRPRTRRLSEMGRTLHQLARPDLAQAGHRLEQVDHAHLADDLVVLPLLEHVDDRGAGVLVGS